MEKGEGRARGDAGVEMEGGIVGERSPRNGKDIEKPVQKIIFSMSHIVEPSASVADLRDGFNETVAELTSSMLEGGGV